MIDDGHVAEVYAKLGNVTDPELDEPVTELGFVTGVAIDREGVVAVQFRLPTYWCAANFAFMMADDMRREVAALPWVSTVEPRLGEHMYSETINHGVAHGLSFAETFGDEAQGDLDELRRTFLVKSFLRRQEALLRYLLATGETARALVALTMPGLSQFTLDGAGERHRARYVERRGVAGPLGAEVLAFVDVDGSALAAADLPLHLRTLQRVSANAEFNGALCSGLLAARFNEPPRLPGAEPTLRDFIRDAALRPGANGGLPVGHGSDV